MNIKQIKELVELMNGNDLAEIEIEQEGVKIKVVKKQQGLVGYAAPPLVGITESAQKRVSPAPAEEVKTNRREVKSPMVGTFYRAPAPEVAPYVQVGDTVKKGDVLCVVEAMKLMNEVKAEFGGRIVEINVENADPIEFGQTMFVVEVN
ncbi:MAG: acetyl-CoA carboxylase biotin carboxyl carrier protein [Candidatus Omnitrophota bacterium]